MKPFVVAVAGGSGSGKTTFINLLTPLLQRNYQVLQMDHYYKCNAHLEKHLRKGLNFDDPESIDYLLFEKHIVELKKSNSVDRPTYDFNTHCRIDHKNIIDSAEILLVDGIFSLCYPKVNDHYDLKIFIDTEPDLRIARRIIRDTKERGRTVAEVIDQYTKTVKASHDRFIEPTKHSADIVIPWNLLNKNIVTMLAGILNNEPVTSY